MLNINLKKKFALLLVFSLSFSVIDFSMMSAYATDLTSVEEPDVYLDIIAENDIYIENNYKVLFDNLAKNDPHISEHMEILTPSNVNSRSADSDVGYAAISYVVQDEKLQSQDANAATIHALTTVSAIVPLAEGGSAEKYTYDSTVSIKGYTTIYYNTKVTNNITYYLLTKVTGGYTVLDSSVQIVSQNVHYGEAGVTPADGNYQKYYDYTPTYSSWSITTPFTTYVYTPGGGIGATYTINLKRSSGTSRWTYALNNTISQ